MDLSKLFDMQRELDERIMRDKGLEGRDLLPQKILALQVELGELANEWRGFKFWSDDQEPRTEVKRHVDIHGYKAKGVEISNPLLEEYVDCLHFILSIGLDKKYTDIEFFKIPKTSDITYQFLNMFGAIHRFIDFEGFGYYRDMLSVFVTLGEQLGFTWEQIEEAYLKKNKVNHQRQEEGY